jgi:hypothetical protein
MIRSNVLWLHMILILQSAYRLPRQHEPNMQHKLYDSAVISLRLLWYLNRVIGFTYDVQDESWFHRTWIRLTLSEIYSNWFPSFLEPQRDHYLIQRSLSLPPTICRGSRQKSGSLQSTLEKLDIEPTCMSTPVVSRPVPTAFPVSKRSDWSASWPIRI